MTAKNLIQKAYVMNADEAAMAAVTGSVQVEIVHVTMEDVWGPDWAVSFDELFSDLIKMNDSLENREGK
jgi:hypothetical protein